MDLENVETFHLPGALVIPESRTRSERDAWQESSLVTVYRGIFLLVDILLGMLRFVAGMATRLTIRSNLSEAEWVLC